VPYHSLHYHLVWRTQGSQPTIVGPKRNRLLEMITQKAFWLGCHLHAVNAVADHVHLLVGIPPKLSVAQVVGQIKASASTRINREFPDEMFRWQAEYAAFTVSARALPQHIAYVQRQVEHHEQGDFIAAYEPGDPVSRS
jgi:putative transposase